MKKLILLAVLAGLAWWYFDQSRRMTETHIRESYAADMDAMRRFDADSLCARMSDDYEGTESSRQQDDETQHFDKAGQCARIRESLSGMQRISAATGGRLAMEIDYEIKSIELSPNRKQATVQSVSTARLGGMTLARERTTDHLVRRHGRILSVASEARVWLYQPQ